MKKTIQIVKITIITVIFIISVSPVFAWNDSFDILPHTKNEINSFFVGISNELKEITIVTGNGLIDIANKIVNISFNTISKIDDVTRNLTKISYNSENLNNVANVNNEENKNIIVEVGESVAVSFYRLVSGLITKTTVTVDENNDVIETSTIVVDEIPELETVEIEQKEKETTIVIEKTPTIINNPVREILKEIVIEKVVSGVTLSDLQSLNNELRSEIYRVASNATTQSNNNYHAIALTNKIDNLGSVTISNSTITNSSISGTSGSFSSSLSTSGSLSTSDSLTVAGDATFDTNTLYVDSTNNRVGVGTSTPSDTFSINGVTYIASVSAPSNTTDRLYNISNDLYWAGNLVSGSAVGNWTSNGTDVWRATGSVGIGTTSPYAKLSVVGETVSEYFTATSTTATSTFAGGIQLPTSGRGLEFSDGTIQTTAAVSGGTINSGTTGQIPYYSANGTALTATSSLFITTTGNIGIGTTSPFSKLSVAGNGYFDGTVTSSIFTATSTTATSTFPYLTATQSNVGTVVGGTWQGTTIGVAYGGTGLTSYTAGDILYASDTGTLAGTTTANLKTTLSLNLVENTALSTWAGTSNILTVGALDTGSITSGFGSIDTGSSAITTTGTGTFGNVVATGVSATSTFAGGLTVDTNSLVVDYSTNNVGIGTSSPSQKLSVAGTIYSGTGGFQFPDGTTQTSAAGASLWTDGGASTYLTSLTDKLGIGTTSPRAFLDSPSIYTNALTLSPGNTLSALSGFNSVTNFTSGLAIKGTTFANISTTINPQVNLKNIGTYQGGEMHLRSGGTFATKVDYTAGTGPISVSIGDLNGDDHNDLAVANLDSNSTSVFLNNGDGTFATKVDYTTGTGPISVSIGDLNGDGKNDLAVANLSSLSASVLLNNGDGTFATKVDYTTGTAPRSVSIGDLNGDGKNDLAVANYSSNSTSVLLNNGDGTFATKVDYTTGTGPISVSIGDLNGDGKNDLAAANYGSTSASVFLNNGDGTFATKVDYTTGTSPRSVSIGDLNGDGKNDLVVANIGSTSASVFLNNGDGTFATKVDYTTGSSPISVSIGDLNGDGKNDLAVANNGSTSASVFLNNGDGTFATKVDYTTGSSPSSVSIGDLNGDGKNDLAVANNGSTSASVFLNNTSTLFLAQASTGNIGIGTTTPWRTLSVNGTAAFTGLTNDGTGYYACVSTSGELATSTTACGASSQRFKENVQELTYGLDDVLKLRPVSFDWKKDFLPNGTPQIGFIAEEVDLIIPEIIGHDNEGNIMNLDYPKLTAVLVSAVQELYQNIETIIRDTVASISDFVVSNLTVGSQEKPSGITLYDDITGDAYCVKIKNGAMVNTPGECSASTTSTSDTDTEPPTITINGNNPAEIEKGTSYLDLGATVTDNVNDNLGYDVTRDQIDTSTDSTHTITYTATDGAGNTATATRTVIVGTGGEVIEVIAEEVATTTPEVIEEEVIITPEIINEPVVVESTSTTTPEVINGTTTLEN